MRRFRDEKDMSGCAISGIVSEAGVRFSGEAIMESIAVMHERSSGLGGGFAGYGLYPENADDYALHLMFDEPNAPKKVRAYLDRNWVIVREEPIPTAHADNISTPPVLHRCFVQPKPRMRDRLPAETDDDLMVKTALHINRFIDGAFVFSSGKNMGIFKGVGYPEDIGVFFRLDEYEAHLWLAHGRFPTNTTGWWGGAHPFGLLDWAVVHNGEISSYGINRRYLENFGYYCSLHTDTEVVTYLFDLLIRKQALPLEAACRVLAPPFWSEIATMDARARVMARTLRIVYGGALLNGPFSILVGSTDGMVALNDRTKLRPMVAARADDRLYIASEEAAIRAVCPDPETLWHAEGGVPIVGEVKEGAHASLAHTA